MLKDSISFHFKVVFLKVTAKVTKHSKVTKGLYVEKKSNIKMGSKLQLNVFFSIFLFQLISECLQLVINIQAPCKCPTNSLC